MWRENRAAETQVMFCKCLCKEGGKNNNGNRFIDYFVFGACFFKGSGYLLVEAVLGIIARARNEGCNFAGVQNYC